MASRVTYRSRPLQQQVLLRAPGQPVHRHLQRISSDVTREAKALADARLSSGSVSRRVRDASVSGRYRDSFSTSSAQSGAGPRFTVRNTAPHALILERGSRPHVIMPRRQGGVLAFGDGTGLGTVFARRVDHPGTSAYHILDTALRRVMARYR